MFNVNYNPDVLTCLANLSNDEVFTPPDVANKMLDQLPKELWRNKNTTFLDPCTKSGIFLREITKRLLVGLEDEIPDLQERINHILTKQVFGIGITELTAKLSRRSIYCSRNANQEFSITDSFKNNDGNIYYKNIEHTWKNLKCIYCGASKDLFNRKDFLEQHAYDFIHTDNPKELFNMKFDVIVGNPPYQLETGGSGKQAQPIYQKFIETSKKLNPLYLTMIIPSRWFAGGFGLNNFRKEMLNDKRIKKLVDFENPHEVFPGVDIAGGVCYFLWDKNYSGPCEVLNVSNNTIKTQKRHLNQFDIFIRDSKGVEIIKKVQEWSRINNIKFLNEVVSPIKPFGIPSNYKPKNDGLPCYFKRKIGLGYASRDDITENHGLIQKWKLLIPKAPIAGQTDFTKPIRFYHPENAFVAKKGSCCTESWIIANSFDTEEETKNFQSYLFTKTVRFLILQTVISQDVNKKNFIFVPDLKIYDRIYTDEILIKMWGISEDEWLYIDERILEAKLK